MTSARPAARRKEQRSPTARTRTSSPPASSRTTSTCTFSSTQQEPRRQVEPSPLASSSTTSTHASSSTPSGRRRQPELEDRPHHHPRRAARPLYMRFQQHAARTTTPVRTPNRDRAGAPRCAETGPAARPRAEQHRSPAPANAAAGRTSRSLKKELPNGFVHEVVNVVERHAGQLRMRGLIHPRRASRRIQQKRLPRRAAQTRVQRPHPRAVQQVEGVPPRNDTRRQRTAGDPRRRTVSVQRAYRRRRRATPRPPSDEDRRHSNRRTPMMPMSALRDVWEAQLQDGEPFLTALMRGRSIPSSPHRRRPSGSGPTCTCPTARPWKPGNARSATPTRWIATCSAHGTGRHQHLPGRRRASRHVAQAPHPARPAQLSRTPLAGDRQPRHAQLRPPSKRRVRGPASSRTVRDGSSARPDAHAGRRQRATAAPMRRAATSTSASRTDYAPVRLDRLPRREDDKIPPATASARTPLVAVLRIRTALTLDRTTTTRSSGSASGAHTRLTLTKHPLGHRADEIDSGRRATRPTTRTGI